LLRVPIVTDRSTPAIERSDKGLLLLVTAATLGMILVMLPLYAAVMWAAILALVFSRVQRRLVRRLRGRTGLAAIVTLVAVALIVILPLMVMAVSLAREGARVAQAVQSGQIDVLVIVQGAFNALPAPVADLMSHFGIGDADELRRRIEASAGRVAQYFAGHLLNLGQSTFEFLVQLFVALYVAFFMLRDGDALSAQVWAALPLREEDKRELRQRMATVVRATIKGNLVVAIVQGALGGVALAVLHIPGALLAGALMAVLSLLPAVGAALVWLPISIYLVATGHLGQGLGLAAFGLVVIGLVDNVLRPILVGRDTRLPDWVVLVTTIGGIALIGINGFVIGPVVATLFIAVWGLYSRRRRSGEPGPPDPGRL
jgi:predicted PurR-regulated permease PerM